MIEHLQSKWTFHQQTKSYAINGADEFVPCLAHIIHNCVLAFLKEMSATPAESNNIYENTPVQPEETHKRARSAANQSSAVPGRGKVKSYKFLKKLRGFALAAAKLREIAKATSNSAVRVETFQKAVNEKIGKSLKLKLDVATRWHSTATMLERALRLKGPINTWLTGYPDLEALQMSDAQWAQVEIILSVLKPFWESALQLMKSRDINIHMTYYAYEYMFNHLDDFTAKLNTSCGGKRTAHRDQIIKGIASARAKLSKYYNESDMSTTYYAAHYLIPYLKDKLFESTTWEALPHEEPWTERYRDNLKARFNHHYRYVAVCDQNSSSGPEKSNGSHSRNSSESGFRSHYNIFADRVGEDNDEEEPDNLHDEMNLYLNEARIRRDHSQSESQQILEYWKSREVCWPRLTSMARDVLAVPASGIDVEQLFSQGRNTVSVHRHRLNEDTISDIMMYRTAAGRKRRQRIQNLEEEFEQWAEVQEMSITMDEIYTRGKTTLPSTEKAPTLATQDITLGGQLFEHPNHLASVIARMEGTNNAEQQRSDDDNDDDNDDSSDGESQ